MKHFFKKYIKDFSLGALIGAVNGALGAGGGLIAVPLLKKGGMEQKKAHKNAVAVILPITAISALLYIIKDLVKLEASLKYIPTGLLGAVVGTFIISKISNKWLRKIFGAFMAYAGIRLLMK